MEVLYWQLFVIGSVFISFLFGKKKAFWLCIAWTIWTIFSVFAVPLMIIQLFFAWSTYAVISWISDSIFRMNHDRNTIKKQKSAIKELNSKIDVFFQGIPKREVDPDSIKGFVKNLNSIKFVTGNEHWNVLLDTINKATERVCILSGWIGSPLLDKELQDAIRRALNRNIDFYIGYGYQSSGRHEALNATTKALGVLETLQIEQSSQNSSSRGKIFVSVFPTHEKVLVLDTNYIVIGSNNWLSNRNFGNHERSVIIYSTKAACSEGNRVAELVTSHQENL